MTRRAAALALALATACGGERASPGPARAGAEDPSARAEALRAEGDRRREARSRELVARVAGEPIYGAEIEPQGPAVRDEVALATARKLYLDNAIARRLMLLEAARLGLGPDGEGMPVAAEPVAAEPALFETLREREVVAKLVITDAELRDEFAANARRYPRFPRVHLRQVFIPLAAEASPAEVEAQSRRLRDRVAADLRKRPAVEVGDDLGPLVYRLGLEAMGQGILADPALRGVAATLAPGAVTPVLRSAVGLHILICVAREPEGPGTFEDARPRLAETVRERAIARAVDEWMASLRARYGVEIYLQ